jgi:uridine monophosphate synthetase
MNDPTDRIVMDLMSVGAIRFGQFRLKLHDRNPNAPLSPIYVNLRDIRSYPHLLRDVAALLGERVIGLSPAFVADVPTAATPLVGVIAASFNIPMLSPRPAQKTHGIPTTIDGQPLPGAKVVLVDDLITQADSKIEAINILTAHGLRVDDVVVFLDREQGGADALALRGCALHSLLTMTSMLAALVRLGQISHDTRDDVLRYTRGSQS